MEMNKLTIEEQYLTLIQSKELQALGIDFSDANMFVFFDGGIISKDKYEFMTNTCNSLNVALPIILPTLSVAEMLEMLRDYASISHFDYMWNVVSNYNHEIHCNCEVLLRDALFEMLKWLKQNKLI